ncbi:hypothetical protein MHYP_G00281500 [Metynnis hypsauchen]
MAPRTASSQQSVSYVMTFTAEETETICGDFSLVYATTAVIILYGSICCWGISTILTVMIRTLTGPALCRDYSGGGSSSALQGHDNGGALF